MDEMPLAEAPTQAPAPPSDLSFATRQGISLHEAATSPIGLAAPVQAAPAVEAPTPNPVAPAPAPSSTELPKLDTPAPESETAGWTAQKLLDSFGKDLKEGDPRLNQWKTYKGYAEKVVAANEKQALKLAEYERKEAEWNAAPAKAATGETQTPEVLTALQAEMGELRSKHEAEVQEYREWKASQDLTHNEAFRREFDGKQAELFNAAKIAASEVGLEESQLDKVFEAKSELQIRKAIKALELDDEDAEELIRQKAQEHLTVGNKKDALLSGKAGKTAREAAAEYAAHQAEFGGVMSKQLTSELQGQLLRASEEAQTKLLEKSSFFKTEQGGMVFEELKQRFRQGYDLTAEEVVEKMALARIQPIWERHALRLSEENSSLQAKLDTLTKSLPGNTSRPASSPTAPANQTISMHNPFLNRQGIDLPRGR